MQDDLSHLIRYPRLNNVFVSSNNPVLNDKAASGIIYLNRRTRAVNRSL